MDVFLKVGGGNDEYSPFWIESAGLSVRLIIVGIWKQNP